MAGLVSTYFVGRGEVIPSRRRLPLLVPEGVAFTPVVRIESDGTGLPDPGDVQMHLIPEATLQAPHTLQIDFDARESEWDWYARVLRITPSTRASIQITALASWCLDGEPWFAGSTISRVTPMLFRMGPDRGRWLNRLHDRGAFHPACGDSIGISTDEPLGWLPPAKRVYLFSPKPWTREAFDKVCARWH